MLIAFCVCAILCFQSATAVATLSARDLDSLLQGCAFGAFVRPRTGIVYDGYPPPNLPGVRVAALRLRSGSLRRRGFLGLKEFVIPAGLVEEPYVERLVLVYQNLGNWSAVLYPLPGYDFLAPVVGLLAYDAADLSATNLTELDIWPSADPISIRFPDAVESGAAAGAAPMCVCFGIDGSVEFTNVGRGNNTCSTTKQGHFSIVERSSVSPSPAPGGGWGGGVPRHSDTRAGIIIGCLIGGALLLGALAGLFGCARKVRRRRYMRRMVEAAELGAPLPMARLGHTRAPAAMVTRTRPVLENEYMP